MILCLEMQSTNVKKRIWRNWAKIYCGKRCNKWTIFVHGLAQEKKYVDMEDKTFQQLHISPRGKAICISKQLRDFACVHVCPQMSCRVISRFKLLQTTTFISTLQIEPVINTYYLTFTHTHTHGPGIMRSVSYSMNGQLVNVILKIIEGLCWGKVERENVPYKQRAHVHTDTLEMTPTAWTKEQQTAHPG